MRIALLCFWIVLSRVAYYFLIQGSHSGLYYIQMGNLKDICQYIGIAGCLFLLYKRPISPRFKYVIMMAVAYCLSFACIMLYPFLNGEARSNSEQFLFAFNLFWALASVAMFLFMLFYTEQFATKKVSS